MFWRYHLPGNLMSFAGMPCSCRRARMDEDWVDFPERSRPSMTMNAPRFVFVIMVLDRV